MVTQDDVNKKLDDAKDIEIAAAHIVGDDPVSRDALFRLQRGAEDMKEEAARLNDVLKEEKDDADKQAEAIAS